MKPPPDAAPPPPGEPPIKYTWSPNRPLLIVGAAMFLIGHGPNVAVAAPSTAGVVLRVLVFLGTAGLYSWHCSSKDDNPDVNEPE